MIAAARNPAPHESASQRDATGRARDPRVPMAPAAPDLAGAADQSRDFNAALADAEAQATGTSNAASSDPGRASAGRQAAERRHRSHADATAAPATPVPGSLPAPVTPPTHAPKAPGHGNPPIAPRPRDARADAAIERTAGGQRAPATTASGTPDTTLGTQPAAVGGRGTSGAPGTEHAAAPASGSGHEADAGEDTASGANPGPAGDGAVASTDSTSDPAHAGLQPGPAVDPGGAASPSAAPNPTRALRPDLPPSSNAAAGDGTSGSPLSRPQRTSGATPTGVRRGAVGGTGGSRSAGSSSLHPGAGAPAAGRQPLQQSTRTSSGDTAASGQAAAAAATAGSPATTAVMAAAPPASSPPPAVIAIPVATPTGAASAVPTPPPAGTPILPAAMTVDVGTPAVGQPGWAQAVAQAIVTRAGAVGGRLHLQVQPPNLGPVDIALSIHHASATVQIVAQHPLTQAALQQSIPQLHTLLAQQGVQLAHADVTAGHSGSGGHGRDAPPTPVRVDGPTPGPMPAMAMPVRVRTGLVDDYA